MSEQLKTSDPNTKIVEEHHGDLIVRKRVKIKPEYDKQGEMLGSSVNPPHSYFCEACGATEVQTDNNPVGKHCKNCGWKLKEDDKRVRERKPTSIHLNHLGEVEKTVYKDEDPLEAYMDSLPEVDLSELGLEEEEQKIKKYNPLPPLDGNN